MALAISGKAGSFVLRPLSLLRIDVVLNPRSVHIIHRLSDSFGSIENCRIGIVTRTVPPSQPSNHTSSPSSDISPLTLTAIDHAQEVRHRKFRLRRYSPPTKPSSSPSRPTSTQSSTSASTSSSGPISSTITSPQPGAPSAPPHAAHPQGTRTKPTLEKWEEEPSPGLQPVLQQSITIAQDTTTDPVSYRVTAGGDLVLWLKSLFLRDPDSGEEISSSATTN
ncbi:hypothetical protein C8A05DRAFT_19693 [Staphylotrichum tortipilum]|uniref:Uncharacterized protein n=1 Tax=Staphylotrichum tortipilum TaxID=2831512 RepID=A0AAN6MCM0_9PEZI|nr:hypothetical protein C8A05DRAFT_19693 [Staphylotrichum longicolle]